MSKGVFDSVNELRANSVLILSRGVRSSYYGEKKEYLGTGRKVVTVRC